MNFIKRNKEWWAAAMVALFAATYANAGSLYSWSNGEVLTASQLNANFSHIHNNMVGGHGARLVDADVSATASIQQTKIASYHLFPVAWVQASCAPSTCTVNDSVGVTSIAYTSAGIYVVNLSTSLGDTTNGALVSSNADDKACVVTTSTATTMTVHCRTIASSPAATDTAFTLAVFDSN